MMGHVRSIRWTESGWPVVMPERYGAVPQVAITEDELVGNWEHIDLSYSYGKQKESSTMTLAADHTITAGSWKGGTWSYNADKQILTANGVELCLQRETDWEASPRTIPSFTPDTPTARRIGGKKSKVNVYSYIDKRDMSKNGISLFVNHMLQNNLRERMLPYV